MADFCKQCAAELGFATDDFDFAGEHLTVEDEEAGFGLNVLCEGCGPIIVNRDGECVSPCLHNHGDFLFLFGVVDDLTAPQLQLFTTDFAAKSAALAYARQYAEDNGLGKLGALADFQAFADAGHKLPFIIHPVKAP